MSKYSVVLVLAISLPRAGLAIAQQQLDPRPGQGERRMPAGERVMGTVTSVGVDRLTIKTPDGKEHAVLVNDQTRYREGRKDIQLEELKPGDRVFVGGSENSNHELIAMMVRRVTGEEMQRFGSGGDRAFGEIIAIEKGQIKLRNRFQGERVVKIDDQTTFMKEGKPSTPADLKVGDRIMAVGKDSSDGFKATQVMSGPMGQGSWRERRGGPGGPPGDAAGSQPEGPPPQQ
jgi:hypothetical protein